LELYNSWRLIVLPRKMLLNPWPRLEWFEQLRSILQSWSCEARGFLAPRNQELIAVLAIEKDREKFRNAIWNLHCSKDVVEDDPRLRDAEAASRKKPSPRAPRRPSPDPKK